MGGWRGWLETMRTWGTQNPKIFCTRAILSQKGFDVYQAFALWKGHNGQMDWRKNIPVIWGWDPVKFNLMQITFESQWVESRRHLISLIFMGQSSPRNWIFPNLQGNYQRMNHCGQVGSHLIPGGWTDCKLWQFFCMTKCTWILRRGWNIVSG